MGAGWVGLVTAACFAELGHHVFVRDVDEKKINHFAGRVRSTSPD
jgi:UDPglucose 6-dehydrogenase